ncbi:type I restriction enzyme HsdR N-terminal domain-containing protein [Flagellimonas allohymeniacidonis]|uniref:Type I restriction enzyme HsdR N-terminal domain-containing protein n=1 Tax=Flagellimonas allohymeniacidonis TaxID=2517819 RepID=A0A4V2HSS8_9FLAO|nr:type I restriction enzyme HsdR N-terminal domain-containing protein [Allomuricauda hymeniacidonis]TAI48930.1 type I restriction enzyme HsdR N-terminal domain-containing protein [Allomuricauda hymeniacidonis]
MQDLNFPKYAFRIKNSENSLSIFDIVRKKFVLLQPEEWVRQHTLHFLIHTKQYPLSLVNVEKQLVVNQLKKRYDIVVFNALGQVEILVECKSPTTKITQEVFDQIARYNYQLKAQYLMVTNGMAHYFCKMDHVNEKYTFLKEFPDFRR